MHSAVPAHDLHPRDPSGARARRSLIIARHMVNNCRVRFGLTFRDHQPAAETRPVPRSLSEAIDHIDAVYRDYVFYGNLDENDIAGARVLEFGPGDNLGVALQFIAAGAAEVVALDGRPAPRDPSRADGIYRALRDRTRGIHRRNIDASLRFGSGVQLNPAMLQVIHGVGAQDADRVLPAGLFTIVISRCALEHVHEIDRAFTAMDRLLAPGGRMLHRMDLGDYGMFSGHGLHPLEFLTIPQLFYSLMTEYSGQPNRRRVDYYRRKMRELGYFAGLLVTAVAGVPGEVVPYKPSLDFGIDYSDRSVELVRSIRPRLARTFRDLSDEDLMVTGLFLVAQKPG